MNFDINDAIKTIVTSNEYKLSNHSDGEIRESWTIERRIKTKNGLIHININVIAHYEKNLLVFMMPFYRDRSFGLRGKYLYIFDSVLHNINSRTQGGYLSKYTFDKTYAPIYLHHLRLDRMDFDWFKDTLEYFRHAFIAYRPILDLMIKELGLKPEQLASDYDEGRKFILQNKPQYLGNPPDSESHLLSIPLRLQKFVKEALRA